MLRFEQEEQNTDMSVYIAFKVCYREELQYAIYSGFKKDFTFSYDSINKSLQFQLGEKFTAKNVLKFNEELTT